MSFLARFQSSCVLCDDSIEEGQAARMTYDGAAHDRCARPTPGRPVCPRCYLIHATAQEDCE